MPWSAPTPMRRRGSPAGPCKTSQGAETPRKYSGAGGCYCLCYIVYGTNTVLGGFPAGWFARLRDDGTRETINHHLVIRDRKPAVIDSQSVKTTESGGIRRSDVGKKIKGRKRHAMVDTDGRELKLQAHAADVQDRDGAGPLLRASRPSCPFVEVAFADAGYQGPRVAAASPIWVEIVRKSEGQVGFTVHAKRWLVERFFAWINRNRRLAKDVEATIASAEAFLYAACAILLLRRLGR